eukprot:Trichotokara_eunicae@DN4565_c1_g1_i3.p1
MGWAKNKNLMDPIAPRFNAVNHDSIALHIEGCPEMSEEIQRPLHQKNPSLGMTSSFRSNLIFIERDDANEMKENEEITIRSWGNAIITKKKKKKKKKVLCVD